MFFFLNKLFLLKKKLEKELELEKNRTKIIENKYKSINAQHQHNIIHLKMQYEEKLKGLLPIGVKKVKLFLKRNILKL